MTSSGRSVAAAEHIRRTRGARIRMALLCLAAGLLVAPVWAIYTLAVLCSEAVWQPGSWLFIGLGLLLVVFFLTVAWRLIYRPLRVFAWWMLMAIGVLFIAAAVGFGVYLQLEDKTTENLVIFCTFMFGWGAAAIWLGIRRRKKRAEPETEAREAIRR
jgi:hypothetical protein